MAEKKALLILDPFRFPEQLAFVTDRTKILHQTGNHAWVTITDSQADTFTGQGILVQFYEGADQISVPAVLFDPLDAEPQLPDGLSASLPSGDDTAYFLVQFIGPTESEWLAEVEEIGGVYIQDNPVNAVVFRLNAGQVDQARALPDVRWVGLFHPAYAFSFTLAGREEPFSAVELKDLKIDPAQLAPTDTGTLEVVFFDDVTSADARAAVEASGVTVLSDTGYNLVVNATESQLPALLRVPGVFAVERYFEAVLTNQRAGIITQVNQVRDFRNTNFIINLDGTGEIAGVIDSGFDAGTPGPVHPDLAGRITINNLYGPAVPVNTADAAPHGTHTVGTIAGNGTQTAAFGVPPPANPTTVRGMAPSAQVIFHAALNTALANPLDFRGFLRGFNAAHAAGARVHSNSWARVGLTALVTFNVYNNAISGVIDRFAFLHPESLLVFGSGNDERDANGDGIMDQRFLAREAVAKNILCVGACESETNLDGITVTYDAFFPGRFHFVAGSGAAPVAGNFPFSDSANQIAMFSCRGRVFAPGTAIAQRRVKPDIVAPGTNIISTGPVATLPFPPGNARRPNTAPLNFYWVDSGTSMATPVVAGAAVLTRQFYRTLFDQLRRPVLLDRLDQLIDRPTIAPNSIGSVQAWVRRDTAAAQNNIVAAFFDHSLVQQGTFVQLQANVGDHPAPQLAAFGDNTLLLHRGADKVLHLSCYDLNLSPVNAFGGTGAGTVAINPNSSLDDALRPAMCVQGDQVAVVWVQDGTQNLLFQRFSAATGAKLDANPLILGSVTGTSSHPYIVDNGAQYSVVWVFLNGGQHQLLLRLVDHNGALLGNQPMVLQQQAAAMKEPHLAWQPQQFLQSFVVAWVDSRVNPDGSVFTLSALVDGTTFFPPQQVVSLPAGNTARRPFVTRHPDQGFVLLWEDDTQRGDQNNFHFDVYLALLNEPGFADGRVTGNRLRISDTPLDTAGFTCLVDRQGITPVWMSNDEINSDLLGVFGLNLTLSAAFQAQIDPNTPLINSGRFIPHLLNEHDATGLTAVAMAWAGGDYFLLRAVPRDLPADLHLVHTNGDGLPDPNFGAGGARVITSDLGFANVDLHWADNFLIAAHTLSTSVKVFLFDHNGNSVNTFGNNGIRDMLENSAPSIAPVVSHRGTGANFRVIFAYGLTSDAGTTLRYAVLNSAGANVVAPRNLRPADGTARHGWFQFTDTDAPNRSIAAWHQKDAASGNMVVFLNRFEVDGTLVRAADVRLTTLNGDSQNAVIAPRPVLFDPPLPASTADKLNFRRREFGVAWQFHPTKVDPNPQPNWEIRFSRVNRDATVGATHDIQVVANANNATDPQLVWHTDGYGLAWLEQAPAGGPHSLWFTVLDQAGVPVDLRTAGAAAAVPAAFHQVSATGADVVNYHLVWNGRGFRITWVEILNGKLRHMQTALMVTRQQNEPNTYDRPYHHPTAALVRATLINGATNILHTQLPNVGNNPNDGYGWGRLNLRQSLAPLPPVTFYARDDASVASGHTVHYRFKLPDGTRLLRVTLAWTDPPDVAVVNNLNLRMTAPDGHVYVGNRWGAAGTPAAELSDPLPAPPPVNPFEGVHTVEQVVLTDAAAPLGGDYAVEVIGAAFRNNDFQQFPGQPFALVFVGSGQETVYGGLGGGPLPVY